jgi:hypothetical protein
MEKGLILEQLTLPVKTISRARVSQFMSGFDVILGG